MALTRRDFAALAGGAALAPAGARAQARAALIIARGGASAERPAGTSAAFDLAVTEGADYLETGLAPTQDGVLIARDDHELSTSTDIADRPQFAARRSTKTIDGAAVSGWFSEDFSVGELKTLTCRDPAARSRSGGGGRMPPPGIMTFQEVMEFARLASTREGRVIGVCATLRRSAYFASVDLAVEPRTAELIRLNGYNWPSAAMIVRSFETDSLKAIGALTRARRAWMIPAEDAPSADLATARSYAEIVSPPAIALFDLSAPAPSPTPLPASAHAAGLAVHARVEPIGDPYPPKPFRAGDLRDLFTALNAAGVEGVVTDRPAIAAKARAVRPETTW
jgi:glycerophosphoryl diester phosphodiesterase